jgi:vacuolar-type H+-ATPase subunit I/STV1
MSKTIKRSPAEEYLIEHEYQRNEHGVFIYISVNGHHSINMEDVLTDFHHEKGIELLDNIKDLESQIHDLEDKAENLQEELDDEKTSVTELEEFFGEEGDRLLLDENKLEILKRMYKHCSLDDLEAIEAPLKQRVGYLDLIY